MKIIRLSATAFTVPLPRPVRGATYQLTHHQAVSVIAETTEGITGSCYIADPFNHASSMVSLINGPVSDRLVGENPLATARCWEAMRIFTRAVNRQSAQ